MKCFYHDDMDGRAAAFCVHAWVGIKCKRADGVMPESDFIPINYGTLFPFDDILPNEQIWIVDYSIEPAQMERLLSITEDVTWIDHHKTAIDKYADFSCDIRGICIEREAACVLTFKYIHWYTARGDGEERFERKYAPEGLEVPEAILYVGDRDTWAWKYGEKSAYFHAGAALYDTSPASKFWWTAYEDVSKIMKPGETICKFKEQFYSELLDSIGFDTEIDGHKALAMNVARVGSEAFGGPGAMTGTLREDYDILMPFYWDGKQFTISLYSKKVDVSELAKKRGGGGHPGASGFQTKELPIELTKNTP